MSEYRIWTGNDSLSCVDCGTQEKDAYADRCKSCYDRHVYFINGEGWTSLIAKRTED